jgi:iron complex outermembrane receptor protein
MTPALRPRAGVVAGLVCLIAAFAPAARAQEPGAPGEPTGPADTTATQAADTTRTPAADTTAFGTPIKISPVVVTVTRAEKEETQSPRAISVVGETDIQAGQRTLTIDEALARVPGAFANNRNNFSLGERLSIRGFGARATFGIRGVKIVLDGIPQTLADGQSVSSNIDLASAGRIEVIRGPTSSLYGNAAGGVVEVFTETPPSSPTLSTSFMGGEFDLQKYLLKFAGRSGEVGWVVDGNRLNYDGFRDHSRVENTLTNANLTYTPDERSLWRAIFNYNDTPVAESPGSLTRAQVDSARSQANPTNVTQKTGESHHQAQGALSYTRELAEGHTILARLYGLTRKVDNPIPQTIVVFDRFAGGSGLQYSNARRLFGLGNRFITGADLDFQNDDRSNFQNQQGSRGATTLDQDEHVTALGIYLQNETALTERVELTLGARYDRVRFKADDHFLEDGTDDSGVRTLDGGAVDVFGLGLSPMAGLRYSPSEAVNVYANVATSFQTPTTTELANRPDGAGGFNPDLEPEKATSLELGVKGLVGDWLSYQVAGFMIDVRDELIPFEVPDQPQRQFFRNAGSAQHNGVELGASARLGRGVTVEYAYTYSNFFFDEFRTEDAVFDGNDIPGVPPHHALLQVGYDDGRLPYAFVEAEYADAYFVNDANTAKNDSYVVVDLRGGWDVELGGLVWRPFIGVGNLFDEEYNGSVVVNAFGGRFFEPSPGRNVYGGLGVAYAF